MWFLSNPRTGFFPSPEKGTFLWPDLLKGWSYGPAMGFPGGASGKEPMSQCRRRKRCRFDPWVGKIPWRRAWQPTPVFLPRESHGQRSLVGYSPWGHKELNTTERLSMMHGPAKYQQVQPQVHFEGPLLKRVLGHICVHLTRSLLAMQNLRLHNRSIERESSF